MYVSCEITCAYVCSQSTVQLLDDEPLEALKPNLEALLADKEQNKQRAAAEFLGGLLNGLW